MKTITFLGFVLIFIATFCSNLATLDKVNKLAELKQLVDTLIIYDTIKVHIETEPTELNFNDKSDNYIYNLSDSLQLEVAESLMRKGYGLEEDHNQILIFGEGDDRTVTGVLLALCQFQEDNGLEIYDGLGNLGYDTALVLGILH